MTEDEFINQMGSDSSFMWGALVGWALALKSSNPNLMPDDIIDTLTTTNSKMILDQSKMWLTDPAWRKVLDFIFTEIMRIDLEIKEPAGSA